MEQPEQVIDTLKEMADRTYHNMVEVEKALGNIRKKKIRKNKWEVIAMAQFTCSICGDGFEQKSRLQRHIETSHPPQAPSAANVEKVLGGIDYPKTKDESGTIFIPKSINYR